MKILTLVLLMLSLMPVFPAQAGRGCERNGRYYPDGRTAGSCYCNDGQWVCR